MTVTGLEQTPYLDKVSVGDKTASGKPITISEETDRVYRQAQETLTVSEKGETRFQITRDMLHDVVVWNPWKQKANTMSDFGPEDGYKQMICVEAGYVKQWLTLEPGDTWEGGQRIKAL